MILPSAKAETLDISFSGGPLGYSGSGAFSATNNGGVYTVTGVVSGIVTDPYFGSSAIVSLSNYAGPDNLVNPSAPYFDVNGLSFALANGVSINLFFDGFNDAALQSNVNGDVEELVTDSVSVAATPEPSSFVLLGSAALLGMGEVARRRRCMA